MSIKTNISYIFSFTLLLLSAGCRQEYSPLVPETGDGPVEIRLTAKMANVDVSVSRAANEFTTQDILNTRPIGIYALRDDNGGESMDEAYISNKELTRNGEGLWIDENSRNISFPAGKTTAYLYAYAPYQTVEEGLTIDENGTPCIKVKSSMAEASLPGAHDPLWSYQIAETTRQDEGETERSPEMEDVTLSFTHQMARLNLILTSNTPDTYHLTRIKIEFTHGQTGKMSLKDGSITADADGPKTCSEGFANNPILTPSPGPEPNPDSVYGYTALPLDGGNGVNKITIWVAENDNEPREYPAYDSTVNSDQPIQLLQGKATNVFINFNPREK